MGVHIDLAYRRYDDVRRRILIKVPYEDADDVASEVFISALKSAFDGNSVGEFVNWLQTITKRRVAEYHRARPDEPDLPLAEENGGERDAILNQSRIRRNNLSNT